MTIVRHTVSHNRSRSVTLGQMSRFLLHYITPHNHPGPHQMPPKSQIRPSSVSAAGFLNCEIITLSHLATTDFCRENIFEDLRFENSFGEGVCCGLGTQL